MKDSRDITNRHSTIEFLRKKATIADFNKFKGIMEKRAGGFGGLISQQRLMMDAISKEVFERKDEQSISNYLFAIGIRKAKLTEFMERLELCLELFVEIVQERTKTETGRQDESGEYPVDRHGNHLRPKQKEKSKPTHDERESDNEETKESKQK